MEVDEDRIEGENSGTAVLGRHSNCNQLKMITRVSIRLPVLPQNFNQTHEKWNSESGGEELGEVNWTGNILNGAPVAAPADDAAAKGQVHSLLAVRCRRCAAAATVVGGGGG